MLAWLAAALHPRGLLVRSNGTLTTRLSLVQGLMMLLPPTLRTYMSFSTHSLTTPPRPPAIIFSPAENDSGRWRISKSDEIDDGLLEHPYIAHLLHLWQQNILDFVATLRDIDRLAGMLIQPQPGMNARDALTQLTVRHQQDLNVRQNAPVGTGAILTTLTGDAAPEGDLRLRYFETLLRNTLDERDPAASKLIATTLDNDAVLDERLDSIFENALESQPDAVYAFVRNRLSEGVEERWLERLHESARRSLSVAISSGDTPTLIGWLKLITREPASYRLRDILHEGLLTARERVGDNDSELARELLTLAVKRDPNIIPALLEDPQMQTAQDDTLAAALKGDARAIETLSGESRELFLLALAQAANYEEDSISAGAMRTLWNMYENPAAGSLAQHYRPLTRIRDLITPEQINSLEKSALEALFTLMLAAREDELFYELAASVFQEENSAVLATAFEQCGRPIDDIMTLINTLETQDILQPEQIIEICVILLTNRSHNQNTVPLTEKLARTLNSQPESTVPAGVLWQMLQTAATERSEMMARVATRRLLNDIGENAVETQVIELLVQLYNGTAWSDPAHETILEWWRTFTDEQSLQQLQKYDRAFADRKNLDVLHSIVQTTIAMRRALGQRSLAEFADAIATSYSILQALSDAFPSGTRQGILLDRATVRQAINSRSDELTPDVRQVLATNLRELAQLVAAISDSRSKPSLLGPGADDLERALMTGEATPVGAIDMMKFLSGYMEGAHRKDDDEE